METLYLIDYDLRETGQNYEGLITAIKELEHRKICKSSWAIRTSKPASEIRNQLKPYIDKNDILFVAEIGD